MKTRKTWILILCLLLASVYGCGKKEPETEAGPDTDQAAVEAKAKPSVTQETAIDMIERLGGSVEKDFNHPGQPIVNVHLPHTKLKDDDLIPLEEFTQLQLLDLSRTQVTGAGLEHLKGLTQLEKLNLYKTQVTDAGLVHLKGLKQLQSLTLS